MKIILHTDYIHDKYNIDYYKIQTHTQLCVRNRIIKLLLCTNSSKCIICDLVYALGVEAKSKCYQCSSMCLTVDNFLILLKKCVQ